MDPKRVNNKQKLTPVPHIWEACRSSRLWFGSRWYQPQSLWSRDTFGQSHYMSGLPHSRRQCNRSSLFGTSGYEREGWGWGGGGGGVPDFISFILFPATKWRNNKRDRVWESGRMAERKAIAILLSWHCFILSYAIFFLHLINDIYCRYKRFIVPHFIKTVPPEIFWQDLFGHEIFVRFFYYSSFSLFMAVYINSIFG